MRQRLRTASLLLSLACLLGAVWLALRAPAGVGLEVASARVLEADARAPVATRGDGEAAQSDAGALSEGFSIEGVVRDDGGVGLGDVRVQIADSTGAIVSEITTELDGVFVTGGLPLDLYVVRATREGFGLASAEEVVPGGPEVELTLTTGFALSGRVVDAHGRPVAASVHVGGAGLFPSAVTQSDGEGHYEVRGLPTGTYQVVAFAGDRGSTHDARVTISTSDASHDLVVKPGDALQVLVYRGGFDALVESALVTLAREPLHVLAFHEISDETGAATFKGLESGRYYVSVRAMGALPSGAIEVDVPTSGPLEVVLEPGGQVSGRVLTIDGDPVALADITASVKTPEGATWVLTKNALGTLDKLARPDGTPIRAHGRRYASSAGGAYTVDGLPAGTLTLEASKEGWVPASAVQLEIDASSVIDEVVLRLERGRPLLGRVEGPAGGGVASARVRWRLPGERAWREEVRSDDGGVFEFEGVASMIEIGVVATDFEVLVQPLLLDGAAPSEVVLTLSPSAELVLGRVLDPRGAAAVGASVTRVDVTDDLDCRAETDADGVFVLDHCATGLVTMEVRGDGAAPAWFEVAAGEEIQLALQAGASVWGSLVDARSGLPIEESVLRVEAAVSTVGGEPWVYSDSASLYDGVLDVSYLPAGRYTLTIEAEGYVSWTREVTLGEGEQVELYEIALVPGAALEGYVVDAYGAPVESARVWVAGEDEVQSDALGRFVIEAVAPGEVSVSAVHWAVGQGSAQVSLPSGGLTSPAQVRLETPIGGAGDALKEALAAQSVSLARDGYAWQVTEVEAHSPWWDAGLRVGDYIEEWRESSGLMVLRDGERRWLRVVSP